MSKYQKTAKDRAFDRERQKLHKQINELREENRKNIIEIKAKEAIIERDAELLDELTAENQKLKDLLNIPSEQLEAYLKYEREKAERQQKAEALLKFAGSITGGYNNGI